ncbi:Bestrophin/UPF0187, partial [Dimargaris cristalligena]
LLVFRTNTAYDRYWEGRKVWSQMVLAIRNLARLLWTIIPEELASEKDVAVHLLHAFAVAVKCYLHGTDPFVEMEHIEAIRPVIPTLREYYQAIIDSVTAEDLQSENATVPYVVSLFISNYIVHAKDEGHIDAVHLGLILNAINTLTECLTGYERIQRTPIPVAYAIHLHQTVLLYCLALPFQLLPLLNWVTVPITAIVAFTMLGVLHIGKEIENPFGDDDNDLPLD